MTSTQVDWLKFLALLGVLGVLVYAVPVLWEPGAIGILGGALWIFVWPKGDASRGP